MAEFEQLDVVAYNTKLYVVEEVTEDGVYLAPIEAHYDSYGDNEIFLSTDEYNQLTIES